MNIFSNKWANVLERSLKPQLTLTAVNFQSAEKRKPSLLFYTSLDLSEV